MIEQFFQIGENWIDKEEYLFQLIDAIVFLCFMVCVLYLFVFAVYSKRKSTYNDYEKIPFCGLISGLWGG